MKKIAVIAIFAATFASIAQGAGRPEGVPGQSGTPAVTIENAFSPDRGAEELVLKVINTSVSKIRLAAYSFNSLQIAEALLNAKKRGVDVQVIVDARRNQRKNSIAVLDLLFKTGIPTKTISVYAMHHDKYIVADDVSVQNGSFNYSRDAATSNSENVVVVWNSPELAKSFLLHWQNRWDKGIDYRYVAEKRDADAR
ncbi:phospholipase D family protein [Janthinobacterium sp. SUN118]|uniref:phospholipase D family nuclease n=1 Tax=Janthinobacterium sp. SUN118 TaxID=3004100 RepID=UPI0025B01E4E|nr:phospholipase D family protein [Janthinobacterium sp. SUN118]MDN2708810.1 phospholipase D family protein [Janthinobacterium sp. SUN118]